MGPIDQQSIQYQVHEGIIYQSLSGFYYIWSEGQEFTAKPRGNFRHQQMKPLVGDRVKFEVDPEDRESSARLIEILPRKNCLIRPAIANVDYALVVTSLVEPDFSYNLLDYFLVTVESYDIQPIIILSKYDSLVEREGSSKAQVLVSEIKALYEKVGYQVFASDLTEASLAPVRAIIEPASYVVMGQSGVGKSTLLNQLLPDLSLETGEISQALNRGRHTTREVTLYRYDQGLIADTPGFSAIDFDQLTLENLGRTFPEIHHASSDCKFRTCVHLEEPACAVKEAVTSGEIAESRYQNYLQILERIRQRKPKY